MNLEQRLERIARAIEKEVELEFSGEPVSDWRGLASRYRSEMLEDEILAAILFYGEVVLRIELPNTP